jgi:hypothetical protein
MLLAYVLVNWLVALYFVGLHCSTTFPCCGRANRAVVLIICGKTLSALMGNLSAIGSLNILGGKLVVTALMIMLNEMDGSMG